MFHRREYIRRKVLVHLRRWILLLGEVDDVAGGSDQDQIVGDWRERLSGDVECPSRLTQTKWMSGTLSDKRGFQDPPTSLLDDNICFARNGHKTVVSIERIPRTMNLVQSYCLLVPMQLNLRKPRAIVQPSRSI